jgi:hypothetical protein
LGPKRYPYNASAAAACLAHALAWAAANHVAGSEIAFARAAIAAVGAGFWDAVKADGVLLEAGTAFTFSGLPMGKESERARRGPSGTIPVR